MLLGFFGTQGSRSSHGFKSSSHLFAVIEVMDGIANELAYLVPLANNDDGITLLRPRHDFINGLGA